MDTIEVRQPRSVPAFLVGAGVAVGGLLGWFGPSLAGGLADLLERTPIPVHGLIRLLADVDGAWSLPVLGGLGLVGGIALAVIAAHEAPVLDVTDDHLEHRQEDREVWVERSEVGSVFRDGRDLVLLQHDGGLRARLDVEDLAAQQVDAALRAERWPLLGKDPFEADFEPWVDGRPGFTAEQNTLLRRRRDTKKDVAERQAVDALLTETGLVVRVRAGRLQVRRTRKV